MNRSKIFALTCALLLTASAASAELKLPSLGGGSEGPSQVRVGDAAPNFTLTDINGQEHSLSDYKGKIVVLEWVNYQCPFIQKHYDSQSMQRLQRESVYKGVTWISICSSAPGKQGYFEPDQWLNLTQQYTVDAAIILPDPSGEVGRSYGAATTPHMFIIDASGKVAYSGAIDDKPGTDPAELEGATNYVSQALNELLAGKPVSEPSTKPYGCSVKY